MNLEERIINVVNEIENHRDELNIPRKVEMDIVQVGFDNDYPNGMIKTVYTKDILDGLVFRVDVNDEENSEYTIDEYEIFSDISILRDNETGEYRGLSVIDRHNVNENDIRQYGMYFNVYNFDNSHDEMEFTTEHDWVLRDDDLEIYYVNSKRSLPDDVRKLVENAGSLNVDKHVGGWARKGDKVAVYFIVDLLYETYGLNRMTDEEAGYEPYEFD